MSALLDPWTHAGQVATKRAQLDRFELGGIENLGANFAVSRFPGVGPALGGEPAAVRVLIVGGGYCGITAAHALDGLEDRVQVIVADRSPVAEEKKKTKKAIYKSMPGWEKYVRPYEARLRKPVGIVHGEALGLDFGANRVTFPGWGIEYDIAVLTTGCHVNTLGNPQILESTYSLDTFDQALAFRKSVLEHYKRNDSDADRTAVIVGAGLTGLDAIEATLELRKEKRLRKLKIVVVHSGKSTKKLKKLSEKTGVTVHTGCRASVDGNAVHLKDGTVIEASTIGWHVGLQGHSLLAEAGLPVDANGRVLVNKRLNAMGGPDNVFFGGDAVSGAKANIDNAKRQGKAIGRRIREYL